MNFWYRFERYSGTDWCATLVPVQTLRWYRFADIIIYYIIGRVLFKTQKFEEGIKYFDDAINIWNSKLGESNAGSAEALLYKAKIYAAINKNDEPSKRARICAEKAINILEKIGGWEELINSGYDFLAEMYIKKYPKIADLYLQKIIKR